MRTKILVLYKSDSSSEEMLNTIFEPLSAHWEFEVKKLDLHHASTFGLKEKLWETFSSADSGLLTNLIENKIKSKLVQSLLPKLLTELREFQPPIVLSLDSQGTYLISHLKESGLYLGKVAVLSCGFYFTQEDIKDEVDLYICTSELHRNSLKQLGVKQDKQIMIKNILPSEFFSPTNSEDLNHKFGLLTTMPVILFYVSGSKTADAIEAYKRLLRSNDSFQILVFNPDNTMIPEFEKISAPP
ncbi:MAG TPA: hypothetical protein VD998_02515, partial [Verrucomicrobiae bacterium]|nr:hypothetical protein [Verrucomicrobiae bacterium]